MRFYGDLPFKEIAAAHGKSESWAKMTYLRGKEKMWKRSIYEADGNAGRNWYKNCGYRIGFQGKIN